METTIFLVIECVSEGSGILTIRDSFISKDNATQYVEERPYSNLVVEEIKLKW